MNREDIIRMAREAGFNKTGRAPAYYAMPEEIERFAALVAAHIRETEFKPDWNNYRQGVADGAAAERTEMAKHCAEITRAAVTKAVDGAIALEREACAKVCEAEGEQWLPDFKAAHQACVSNAAAIRARSNT